MIPVPINAVCQAFVDKRFPGSAHAGRRQGPVGRDQADAVVASQGPLRHSRWDAVLVGLAFLHGLILVLWPSIPVIALGLWWNSNTVAHNFIHLPFFHSRTLNRGFSIYLSALLGVPQSLWRARHLAHHANRPARLRLSRPLLEEIAVVLTIWSVLAWVAPAFLVYAYLPGYLLGLGLCQLHGFFEHWRGTSSHYGPVYNFLFFNDGFHAEHHASPRLHWRALPRFQTAEVSISRWPACLRWIEIFSLDSLERLVLHFSALQRFVLARHERAFQKLLLQLPPARDVAVVGGGLYPRTPLVLEKLLPRARIRVIDANQRNINTARRFLNGRINFEHRLWEPSHDGPSDLVVLPLAFIGNRTRVYRETQATAVIVHDWIWRPRGVSVVVSWLLLKRLNLIHPLRSEGH